MPSARRLWLLALALLGLLSLGTSSCKKDASTPTEDPDAVANVKLAN